MAQDERQAAGDRPLGRDAAGGGVAGRHRPGDDHRARRWSRRRPCPRCPPCRPRPSCDGDGAAPGDRSAPGSPVRRKFGRRKFDKQPTQKAAVLIASNGEKIPGAAIRQALRISAGRAGGGGDHRPYLRLLARAAQPGPDADPEGDGRAEGDRAEGGVRHREGRVRGLGSDRRLAAAVQDDRAGGGGPGGPARARGPAREGRVAPGRRGRRRQGGGQEARARGHRRGSAP